MTRNYEIESNSALKSSPIWFGDPLNMEISFHKEKFAFWPLIFIFLSLFLHLQLTCLKGGEENYSKITVVLTLLKRMCVL